MPSRERFPSFSTYSGRTYSGDGSRLMTGTPFVFSNHTHFSHLLCPSHVLLTATFALSYCHTLSSPSVLPSTPFHAFSLPSRQLLQSPNAMRWSFEGRKTWKGGKLPLQMKWAADTRLSTPRGSSLASLALEGLRIPKAHSLHSAVANLIFPMMNNPVHYVFSSH